jgi:Domain of unknown function (DUF4423)
MNGSPFREKLRRELEARRRANPRYSLRAMAAFLGTDHPTLSQVLRGKRPIPVSCVRRWGRKLSLTAEEVAAYVAAEHVPTDGTLLRQEQLRHWTAEALAIVTGRIHWQVLELLDTRDFQPDARWIAKQIGTGVDEVNVALTRLLRLQLLKMGPAGRWRCLLASPDENQFRKRALIKIRKLAAEGDVNLRRPRTKSPK